MTRTDTSTFKTVPSPNTFLNHTSSVFDSMIWYPDIAHAAGLLGIIDATATIF